MAQILKGATWTIITDAVRATTETHPNAKIGFHRYATFSSNSESTRTDRRNLNPHLSCTPTDGEYRKGETGESVFASSVSHHRRTEDSDEAYVCVDRCGVREFKQSAIQSNHVSFCYITVAWVTRVLRVWDWVYYMLVSLPHRLVANVTILTTTRCKMEPGSCLSCILDF
jgi:hypothetical protein